MSSDPLRQFSQQGAQVLVFTDSAAACQHAAQLIAHTTREALATRRKAVLGLATGGTPVPVYRHLVQLHREHALSFRDVVTYNLDEYYPISPLDPNSYRHYMQRHLFDHVDLPPNQAHLLDGTVPRDFVADHCAAFDRWIAADGGLDLQLLGIGRNGHIGFNEPSDRPVAEALKLPTRLESLHPVTVEDAARDFGGNPDAVPRQALTMGVAPILAARSVLILAFGPAKTEAVRRALTEPPTASLPATLLRHAAGPVTWLLDPPAAAGLDGFPNKS